MPIKKRSSVPTGDEIPTDDGKLHIVAKPKRPMPDGGKLADTYGDANPTEARRLGLVAIACSAGTPDEAFTIEDRVRLMRTPYDENNPQEARYRNRVRNRGTAVTAMCITCQGGRKAVTECIDTTCPLWAFRFGSDPFYGRRK